MKGKIMKISDWTTSVISAIPNCSYTHSTENKIASIIKHLPCAKGFMHIIIYTHLISSS